jgi:hypothetical protein
LSKAEATREWFDFWTAVAKRSGDTAFESKAVSFRGESRVITSGVALRFPPQSKIIPAGRGGPNIRRDFSFQIRAIRVICGQNNAPHIFVFCSLPCDCF